MRLLNIREIDSFRAWVAQNGIRPVSYARGMEAIEGVDALLTVVQLGDRVLALARSSRLAGPEAERLLEKLEECYRDPLRHARLVARIASEVTGYES
jgi:hypothetical protein